MAISMKKKVFHCLLKLIFCGLSEIFLCVAWLFNPDESKTGTLKLL